MINLKNELNSLSYNGEILFKSDSSNKSELMDLINKSKKIIEVLKNNPDLNIEELKVMSINDLETLLKSFSKVNPTVDELTNYFSNLSQNNYLSENILENIKMFMNNSSDKEKINKS